jgi:hypothetical protein
MPSQAPYRSYRLQVHGEELTAIHSDPPPAQAYAGLLVKVVPPFPALLGIVLLAARERPGVTAGPIHKPRAPLLMCPGVLLIPGSCDPAHPTPLTLLTFWLVPRLPPASERPLRCQAVLQLLAYAHKLHPVTGDRRRVAFSCRPSYLRVLAVILARGCQRTLLYMIPDCICLIGSRATHGAYPRTFRFSGALSS